MKYRFCILSVLLLLLGGCFDKGKRVLVSATGSIYECVVVIPDVKLPFNYKFTETDSSFILRGDSVKTLYDVVRTTMEEDMPCLPQKESYFNTSRVVFSQFDNFLMSARNILIVDIDSSRYTQNKSGGQVDCWSHPQAVYRIHSPSDTSFLSYWIRYGKVIREWFVRQEISRQLGFYEKDKNVSVSSSICERFRCHICIPRDFMLIMDTSFVSQTKLVWCCNDKGSYRRDFIIYSYPYEDDSTLTKRFLCCKRDSILGRVVTSSSGMSHMGTEYNVFPPQVRSLHVQKSGYAMELRGLWKMRGGEAMGGPFVSHTRIDEINKRVITAEVFIYGAGQKKRNVLRQNESILYSLQLEQEFNELDEVKINQ